MIFVTVGTQIFQMDRLLMAIDELAGCSKEEFFVQTGHSGYVLKHCAYSPFLDRDTMNEKVEQCSLMICHAGVGSILLGLKRGKKVVVVPRLKMFGEHVDDHQVEIAGSFANAGYIKAVQDVSTLAEAIKECAGWEPQEFISNKEKFNQLVLECIRE